MRSSVSSMLSFLALAVVLMGAAGPDGWDQTRVRMLLVRAQQAANLQDVKAKDRALADLGGIAYKVERRPGEGNESYAKRTLRTRDPEHPAVKKGQWLSALMRIFYSDVSARCRHLARFELDIRQQRYFEQMSKEAKNVADMLGNSIQLVVEGLEGFVEPLPIAKGTKPEKRGAAVAVHEDKIEVERLNRITFEDGQPPVEAKRTPKGALHEVFSAFKQYNISAQMLGRYDKIWRRNRGHFHVVVPAASPAIYLNEIARAALEGKMHTMHLLTMSKRGDLGELKLKLKRKRKKPPKKKRRKSKKKQVEVQCGDEQSMQDCAKRIVHATTVGTAVYVVD